MKVGMMGGTFDPIHTGHLLAAERALEGAGLDEVWFMPVNVPPHKPDAPQASPLDRLRMTELAVAGNPRFKATDVELRKGGTSYTVETMEMLIREHAGTDFYYIIGADMVMYLPRWHRIGDLVGMVRFIGLKRPGFELDLEQLPEYIRNRITIIPMPEIGISSTDIRMRLSRRQSVRYMVPDPVLAYIERNGLYGSE